MTRKIACAVATGVERSACHASIRTFVTRRPWRVIRSGRVLSRSNDESVGEAVSALERVLGHVAAEDKDFFRLDDEDYIDDATVAKVLAEQLPNILREEVRTAINRITGRLD